MSSHAYLEQKMKSWGDSLGRWTVALSSVEQRFGKEGGIPAVIPSMLTSVSGKICLHSMCFRWMFPAHPAYVNL